MHKRDCTVTVSELLYWQEGRLALRGRDGDDDEDDDDTKGDAASGDDDGDGGDDGSETLTPEQIAELQRKITNYEEERDRIHGKRKDAEKKRDELQQQLDELTREGANDEAIKEQLTQLGTENASLKSDNDALRMQVAFLKSNKYDWQDAEAALKLADLSDVEIDDDGTVNGLDEALGKLAREKAYLLKPKDGGSGSKKQPPSKTGETPRPGGSNDAKSQAATEARLRAKYPALRRR